MRARLTVQVRKLTKWKAFLAKEKQNAEINKDTPGVWIERRKVSQEDDKWQRRERRARWHEGCCDSVEG